MIDVISRIYVNYYAQIMAIAQTCDCAVGTVWKCVYLVGTMWASGCLVGTVRTYVHTVPILHGPILLVSSSLPD